MVEQSAFCNKTATFCNKTDNGIAHCLATFNKYQSLPAPGVPLTPSSVMEKDKGDRFGKD
jgi:hypothetical protein